MSIPQTAKCPKMPQNAGNISSKQGFAEMQKSDFIRFLCNTIRTYMERKAVKLNIIKTKL